jgi:hypothetical protein
MRQNVMLVASGETKHSFELLRREFSLIVNLPPLSMCPRT